VKHFWVLAVLAACGGGSPGSDGTENPPPIDITASLFSRDALLEVSITLNPTDWDSLCAQTRNFVDLLGPNCLAGNRPDPFTYFPAEVTIDGDVVTNVGVRKKGFLGSLSETRPSLKISFDEYDPEQRYRGMKKLTLNNSQQDPSYIKQCLGYDVFARAGVPASRCSFAHVVVNGNDLGVYVNVESLNKQFIARHFADNDGNLYEGALSDFRPEWVNTFEKKTNETDPDRSDLDALVTALEAADEALVTTLEPLIELDGFYTLWAAEVLIAHWDGYAGNTNNFYIYNDPTSGRFHFIPWGIDGTFADNGTTPHSVLATGALAWRLYRAPASQAVYRQRLRDVLTRAWNEDDLLDEVDGLEALITPVADPDGTLGLPEQLDAVRTFISSRAATLEPELDGVAPTWDAPLRDPPCFETVGQATATFDTTWGTAGAANPFITGSGTWDVTVADTPWTASLVSSTSGDDPDNPGQAIVQVVSALDDGTYGVLHIVITDPTAIASGATLDLDLVSAYGLLFHFDGAGNGQLVGFMFDGSITFDAAGTTNGAPVTGSLASTISTSGF
jgi:hypothetical protein